MHTICLTATGRRISGEIFVVDEGLQKGWRHAVTASRLDPNLVGSFSISCSSVLVDEPLFSLRHEYACRYLHQALRVNAAASPSMVRYAV